MSAWHMDHMVRAVLYHNSSVSQYNSGFHLRMQTGTQKLHSWVIHSSPQEGYFPSLGDMKAWCRTSVNVSAMAQCCRACCPCASRVQMPKDVMCSFIPLRSLFPNRTLFHGTINHLLLSSVFPLREGHGGLWL